MLTKYDKAGAAAIGAALATLIVGMYPMGIEMQGALTVVLSGGLAWAFPNKET